MNLLIFDPQSLTPDRTVTVSGRQLTQLRDVLKVEPGSVVRVGVRNGGRGTARIISVDGDGAVLQIETLAAPAPTSSFAVVLGLPRPQILKRVLFTSGMLGLSRLVLTGASRVEKSYFSTSVLRPTERDELLLLGMEQGGMTSVPTVELVPKFSSLVREMLPGIISQYDHLLLGSMAPECPSLAQLFPAGLPQATAVLFAVGPEGGLLPYEEAQLIQLGFRPVTLGEPILRVDSAVTAIWSQLELLRSFAKGG